MPLFINSQRVIRFKDHLSRRLHFYRQTIAEEMKLPDIKGRHLFTARLRIILFLATWLMFFLFFPSIFVISPFVPLIFNVGFLLTAICHLLIIRHNKIFLSVLGLEIFADVISQTVIIYILGHESWAPFLIYGLYVTAMGTMSGYHASILSAVLCLVSYLVLFVLIRSGVLLEFVYPYQSEGLIDFSQYDHYLGLFFLPVVLLLIVYSVRISNFFSHVKEHALERRNVQLTALNQIGATIRVALHVKTVIDEVLKAVIQGLGFDVCFLALMDEQKKSIQFYMPQGNYYTFRLEEILGLKHEDMHLPLNVKNNSAYMAIFRNRVLVRNNLSELLYGIQPEIPLHRSIRAQKILGFRKFVITPLVAEQRVVGAIIGASRKAYVEETTIDTLDNFANQAALAIESAQLIETLEHKNEELIKADKLKSEFLAIMSHELRTPLNAVLGYTEALVDKSLGDLNEDQIRSLKEVMRNGGNLLELVNSILDLAKIESGSMELSLDDFDVRELIDNVGTTLKPLLEKKKQRFEVMAPDRLPFMKADALKMRQVMTNLVGNGIKFTEEGGSIKIMIQHFSDITDVIKRDFLTHSFGFKGRRGSGFVIRVRDSGIGIREDDLSGIFELFKQADSSVTRRHEGTGLGLALTKELVLLHRGLISVESHYGKGTEFRVLIPQSEESSVSR